MSIENEFVDVDFEKQSGETFKAIRFFDGVEHVWIPCSVIGSIVLCTGKDLKGVTVGVKRWFAEKEGLV